MRSYEFELTGSTALLMHKDDVLEADRLGRWRKAPQNKNAGVAGDDRSPGWTWQTYCYHDDEYLAMPTANLAVAIRQAAVNIILKKQKTFKELSQAGMQFRTEFAEFLVGQVIGKGVSYAKVGMASMPAEEMPFKEQADAVRKLGFKLFVKRASVGRAKHVRTRPRFDHWKVRGSVDVTAPEITTEILEQLFEWAGRVGLCDWRPGCKTPGPFGMFTASVKEI